jgi:hypothetical protein
VIVRVAPHIRPVHAGVAYQPGEVVDNLPMSIAVQWIGSGWASEVD